MVVPTPHLTGLARAAVLSVLVGAALAGCASNGRIPSSYDLKADDYFHDSPTRCERYAYQTGRVRYENEISFTGQAWAAKHANDAAELAFQRCSTGRVG